MNLFVLNYLILYCNFPNKNLYIPIFMGFQIFNKKILGRSNFSQLTNLILFLQIKKVLQLFKL